MNGARTLQNKTTDQHGATVRAHTSRSCLRCLERVTNNVRCYILSW